MQSSFRRASGAAIFVVCAAIAAACNTSSPVEPESISEAAGAASKFEVAPIQVDLGTTATSASITIKNTSNTTLSWTASENTGWLSLGTGSGTIGRGSSKKLSFSVQRSGLAPGDYSTGVTITTNKGGGSETISVGMAVTSTTTSSTTFSVSPLKVDFGTTATKATVTLTNSGNKSLTWTASERVGWLAMGATSGTIAAKSKKTVGLKVNRTGKSAGSYSAYVKFSAGTAGSARIPVTMTVPSTSTTTFSVSPLQVDFGSTATSASVTLTNSGGTSLTWTASEGVGWLALGATSGTIAANSSKTLGLTVNRTGATAGSYTTNVDFSAGTAGSARIPVSMSVASTSTSVTLAGQLVDQFDGHALAGLTVQYNGVSVTTNSSGQFTIAGSPISSLQQLTISGTGVHRRITYAKTGDSSWRVVPSSFSMTAFNDVARDEFGPSTVRWVEPPTVYVDSRPEGFSSSELSTWISEVQVQAAEFVSKWSGAKVEPAAVIVTSNPPSDFSPGTIVIHFSENSSDYGGSSTSIGYAKLSYLSSGAISGSAVWLRYLVYSGTSKASKRKGILGHELGHAMGLGHMGGSTESFMEPSIGTNSDLKDFDKLVASLLYTRSPHNASPDTDSSSSYQGSLSPSALPVVREWMCGAGEELLTRR